MVQLLWTVCVVYGDGRTFTDDIMTDSAIDALETAIKYERLVRRRKARVQAITVLGWRSLNGAAAANYSAAAAAE